MVGTESTLDKFYLVGIGELITTTDRLLALLLVYWFLLEEGVFDVLAIDLTKLVDPEGLNEEVLKGSAFSQIK